MTGLTCYSGHSNYRSLALMLLLGLSALLLGCKQQMMLPQAFANNSLDNWMEAELTPYLQQQISQHPRFKGQRLEVVKINGQQVATDMDQLTADIRDRINASLLRLPDSNLVWQSNSGANQPINSNTALQCHQGQNADYLIGIETQLDDNQQLSVSIRALDTHEQLWVSGFGKHWQGRINSHQKQALQTTSTDQSLRGQRMLPFEPQHGDVVARELAHQLSCKLLKQQDEPVRIYIPQQHQDPFIETNLKLFGHYMTQFQEATITQKPKQAQLLIAAELQPINNDLNQFLISAREIDGSTRAGLTADTYIRLPPLALRIKNNSPSVQVVQQASQKTSPASTLEVVPVIEKSHNAPTRVHSRTRQAASLSTNTVSPAESSPLFSRIVLPKRQQFCRGPNPWRRGERYQTAGPQRQVGDCFALEMEVPSGYQAFLIREDSNGSLHRLAPDSCQGLVRFVDRRGGSDTLRFPSKHGRGKSAALRIGNQPSTFYALAIKPGRAAQRLRQHITRLPGHCGQGRQRSLDGSKAEKWLAQLRRLSGADTQLIWQAQVIRPSNNHPRRDYYPGSGEVANY